MRQTLSDKYCFFAITMLTLVVGPRTEAVQLWKRLGPLPADMQLGTTCKSSLQCLLFIPHSHCDWEQRTCTCQPYHVRTNETSCLPASLLGFACSVDEQCTLKVPNAQCTDGVCQCKDNYLPYRRDKCLPPARINDYCLSERQCTLGNKYSTCKYIIPRIYGKCKCPVGHSVTKEGKCLPLLGKRCELDEDCSQATSNSFCKLPSFRSSSKEPVCACRPGFKLSDNKLSCEPIPKPPVSAPIINLLDSPNGDIALVSLGKPCSSSIECQVRDPYSTCKNGTCECLQPTGRCNARHTGCHNDTFQCRSGQCISWYFVCDKNKNCDDGSDEMDCTDNGCPKEAFRCNDGTCLSRASVCNGRMECADGSDEAGCYKGIKCNPKSFQCKSGQCVPQYAFCNAVTDCLDGSDEDETVCENSSTCPKGTFQCGNNRCRSTAILCSGVDGCGNNADEGDGCEVCYCEKPSRLATRSRTSRIVNF